jgi:hypothetical protein
LRKSGHYQALYSLAAANHWHMFFSDITQAFTYDNLDVPLFCHPPPGFDCPSGTILGLKNFELLKASSSAFQMFFY